MKSTRLLLLGILLYGVSSEKFTCKPNQPFCFWTSAPTNWRSAFSDCTTSGGSLVGQSFEHSAYIDEWMSAFTRKKSDLKVWSSLHRINHHFQWLHDRPTYQPVAAIEWAPGHPLIQWTAKKRDCVVVNHRMLYESVNCDDAFEVICAISSYRKLTQLNNLDIPQAVLSLNLTLEPNMASQLGEATRNSFMVNKNDSLSALKCNIAYSGSRKLEISWLKDGVYLENNNSALILAEVNDKSKTFWTDGQNSIYSKQGTYQCQVREFGALNSSTSNSIVLTYKNVLNGIVSLWPSEFNSSFDNHDAMEAVVDFIKQRVLKEYFKFSRVRVAWDPLFSLPKEDGLEIRNSLYIDIDKEYPDGYLFHFSDVISDNVLTKFNLKAVLGLKKIQLSWATYCRGQNQSISLSSNDTIKIEWPSSLADSKIYPLSGKYQCIQKNNSAEFLNRICSPDFIQGAFTKTLDTKTCDRLVEQPKYVCRNGYQWMENLQLCYKITDIGSWNETMAICVSDWPAFDMAGIDYNTHLSVLSQLQAQQNINELWLPTRRLSTYGPLLYYYTTVDYGPDIISPLRKEHWTEPLLDEECMFLDDKGSTHLSDCSKESIPTVCVYRPKHGQVQSTNLCPPPWYGYRIHQGRLVCFSVIQSELPIGWHQAEEKCREENSGYGGRISIATFEDTEKALLWQSVQSQQEIPPVELAWIGLRWSESHGQFCWFNSKVHCQFQYYNWRSSINWTQGHYGVVDQSGLWNVLSHTSPVTQVVCQAEFDLSLNQKIVLRHQIDPVVTLDIIGHLIRENPVFQSFYNLEELSRFHGQPFNSPLFPVTETGVVKCFLDGELYYEAIGPFPATFQLNSTFSIAPTLNCEGWVGWPRRFVRTEPTVVLRPPDSAIILMLIDVEIPIPTEGQLEQEEEIDFHSEPISDISQKLERLRFHGVILQMISHRWWIYQEKTRLLLRVVIKNAHPDSHQHNWPELIKSVVNSENHTDNQFSYQLVKIISGEGCQEETTTSLKTARNLSWNTIPIGFSTESTEICLNEDGHPIIRRCLGNPNTGAFWDLFDISTFKESCREETELLKTLKKMTKDVTTGSMDPISALDDLGRLLNHSIKEDLVDGFELGQAARLLRASIVRLQQLTKQEFQQASQAIVMMLGFNNQLQMAQSLPGISNDLLESLEQMTVRVVMSDGDDGVTFRHPKMNTDSMIDMNEVIGYSANVDKNNLEIVAGKRILENISNHDLFEDINQKDVSIILPVEEIRKRAEFVSGSPLRISFTILANADLFDAKPVTPLLDNGILRSFFIDSPVIIAQVGDSSISNLNHNVRIFFRARTHHNQSVIPICVFWDKSSASFFSGWSRFGCQYVGRSQDLYICECNHLTPLALLFPYFDDEQTVDFANHKALSLISLIGCFASMIGLSLVLLTFLMFKKWRRTLGNKILFNFSLALFFLTACFLSASQVTFDRRLCKANASAMHYFLLASFAWMVVEGVYQYYNYVIIIGTSTYKSGFMRKAGPLAWGLPILPVLGILIYDSNLYTSNQEFCWMTLEAFYFTILIPVCTSLFFNVLIFVAVLKSVLCVNLRTGMRSSQTVRTRSLYQFRMAVCIFFLLGLAWVFGFVSLGDSRMVFAYLFCIFSSLQGFFIFIFFVFKEKNARKLWLGFVEFGTARDKLLSVSKSQYASRTFPVSR